MNILNKCFPLIILLLTGCTSAKLLMRLDTALEANATVYELNYPGSLTDKLSGNRMNVSFGPYRVTDADTSWARTRSLAEDPDPIFMSKSTRKSGNTTTTTKIGVGPTEIFGFSRPTTEGEPSIEKVFQTITYKFNVGHDISWNAHCAHRAKKRVTHYENTSSVELLSSNFTCQYTPLDKSTNNEVWILSVDDGRPITMMQKGKPITLTAHSTGGTYVMTDGKPAKLTNHTAGYTWNQFKDGHEKNITAISVREETPRVWLDKGNTDTINHVLSMANTGLLIYSWEIQH